MPEIIEQVLDTSIPSYEEKLRLIQELRVLVSSKFPFFRKTLKVRRNISQKMSR